MKLVITEKNDAAEKIAALLSEVGKPTRLSIASSVMARSG